MKRIRSLKKDKRKEERRLTNLERTVFDGFQNYHK